MNRMVRRKTHEERCGISKISIYLENGVDTERRVKTEKVPCNVPLDGVLDAKSSVVYTIPE